MAESKAHWLAGRLFPISPFGKYRDCRARATGEYRKPRKGEWFLSGAIVEGYQAVSDMASAYYIAELVEIKTVEKVVRVLPPTDLNS